MFISRSTLYPSIDNFEQESTRNVIRFKREENKILNGTYYIAVYGWSRAYYMITPLVVRSF